MPPLNFACPYCKSNLADSLSCNTCGRKYSYRGGIYRFLLPERYRALSPFLSQYRAVRKSEGYQSRPAHYYRSLPYTNRLDPQAQTWRVRAETFDHLLRRVLGTFESNSANNLAERVKPSHSALWADADLNRQAAGETGGNGALGVLDLGAGNGWLSHRLTMLGHRCVAVDCDDDADDGLGAFSHYTTPFICVQADFDQLPFAHHQFDVVLFNASLHYSPDIRATLGQACDMLRPGGALVIMDSPTFWSATGGQLMLADEAARMRGQSGLKQLVRPGVGYLAADALIVTGQQLGVQFQFLPSRGSINWALRRLLAGLKRRRAPATFGLWYGRTGP